MPGFDNKGRRLAAQVVPLLITAGFLLVGRWFACEDAGIFCLYIAPLLAAALFGPTLFHATGLHLGHALPRKNPGWKDFIAPQGKWVATGSDGEETHYILTGPAAGGLIVFQSGIGSSADALLPLARRLNDAGYRTLLFDIYGRGWSDSPVVSAYTKDVYVGQLRSLLAKLKLDDKPVTLLGYSMGGAVVQLFAQAYPDLVGQLVLFAPAGLPTDPPTLAKVSALPILGDALLYVGKWTNALGKIAERELKGPVLQELREGVQAKLRYHTQRNWSFLATINSTVRYFPLNTLEPVSREIGKHDRPVLICWGDCDETCPYENHEKLVKLLPRATMRSFAGCGHYFVAQQFEEVVTALLDFLG
eukprot:PLAT156.6.p2 GENE.PLAT156.6~~PLAT156.6.p2  ORF type:complete len:361 (+),score=180.72 PLAT156.6:1558-2640(+)